MNFKNYLKICTTFVLLLSLGCGRVDSGIDGSSLTEEQAHAVRLMKKAMPKRSKFIATPQVTEGAFPVEVLTDEFKSLRDAINKAHIDLRTNQTRNLQLAIEKSQSSLAEYQNEVDNLVDRYQKEYDRKKYLIVMAIFQQSVNGVNQQSKVIGIFNPDNDQLVKYVPVTEAVVNNTIMIVNAKNGEIPKYGFNMGQDLNALAQTVNNPVIKFILED